MITPAAMNSRLFGKSDGFSLLEIVVDIAILASLLALLYVLIDPITQFEKAKDATRKHDLVELQNALDTYYNDTGCYPQSIPFGHEWKEGSTVYMTEVPQDPSCTSTSGQCYIYQVDSSYACPQWNILYATLEKPTTQACLLHSLSTACLPPNYDSSMTCTVSGSVDCDFVSTNALLPSSPASSDGSSSETGMPTPPYSDSCPQSERHYACTGEPARCNIVPAGTGTYCSSTCDGAC